MLYRNYRPHIVIASFRTERQALDFIDTNKLDTAFVKNNPNGYFDVCIRDRG